MSRPSYAATAGLGAVVVAGAAARVAGLWTDLWLDEIWNLNIARGFGYLDILLRVPYDANHILNSLVLRAVGAREWWGFYRLHSLVAGLATIGLAWRVARRWGRLEAGLAAAIVAASFLLILYSSEARGHPMMIAFALGAFLALDAWLEERSPRAYAAWAACVVFGFLSHLMFVQAYAALALWSAWRVRRPPGVTGPESPLGPLEWALLQAPGLAAGAFLYVVQVRLMGHAGGAPAPTLGVLRETLALAVGAPNLGWAWAAGAVGLAAAAWALRDLLRARRDEWVFFAVVVFGAPGLLLLFHPPGLLFPRYFLLAMTFGSALWARAGAAAWRSGAPGKAALAAALALYFAGNASRTRSFLTDGRGHYLDALRHIAEATPGGEATVGSGHDFAHKMMVDFYAPRVPEKAFRYVPRDRWTASEPLWVIGHGERHEPDPPAGLTAVNGSRYRLDRVYRYSEQSGWDWLLYRRATRTSEP